MKKAKNKAVFFSTAGDNHLPAARKFISAWIEPELHRILTDTAKRARRSRSSQLAFIIEERFGHR